MSGIAGLVLRQGSSPAAATVQALAAALAHRGPDGHGQHVQGSVALVQRRLATMDPAGAGQPISAGAAALVADGVVYNHQALQAQHQLPCAPASDSEPALHLYRREGLGFAEHLRGMYAIAIHDRAIRRVVLARDPFGIKPLYLAEVAGGVAFASEPQALLAAGLLPPRLRPEALHELLQLQFTTGAETIFQGISRVLPGETVVLSDGAITERRRREALPEGGPEPVGEAEALERLDQALAESAALHLRTEAPCGAFLSGSIDSATVLALMARHSEAPVLAFTAIFEGAEAAEAQAHAARLAKAAGARHDCITVTAAELWRHLPEIVGCMDDPAADYGIIPAWFLARHARQQVKVVLSGEGGDELFAGHGRYRAARRPWWLGGKTLRAKGAFDRLDLLRAPPTGWRDGVAAAEAAEAGHGRSRLQAAQALDMADWLPNDVLARLDRCLMAHGLEGRTPLLDSGVAAAVFRLPDALKVQRHSGKWLLRQWLADNFPAAEPFRPRPGVSVPVGAWIAQVADRLAPLVAAQPGVAALAKPDRVLPLFRRADEKRAGFAAWHLLFYALWHRRHLEGRRGEGDVFAVLGER